MKKLTMILVAAAMASLVFAQDAGPKNKGQGKGGPGAEGQRRGGGFGRMDPQKMAQELGLTKEQAAQMKTLNDKFRADMQTLFKKYNIERPGAGGPGKGGAGKGQKPGGGAPGAGGPGAGGPGAGGRMQFPEAMVTEMKKLRDAHEAGMKKILTPAQWTKLESMRPKFGRQGGPGAPGGAGKGKGNKGAGKP